MMQEGGEFYGQERGVKGVPVKEHKTQAIKEKNEGEDMKPSYVFSS